MRREGCIVYVSDDDAATLRDLAMEFGSDVATVRRRLELDPAEPADDELLRPRVAAIFRLVLGSA